MDEKFVFLESQLKQNVKSAIHLAEKAQDIVTKDDRNKVAIVSYLNAAYTQIGVAKSIYISNYDLMEHSDVDYFFERFDAYVKKVLDNVATDHSHQWSHIAYNDVKKAYEQSVLF